MVRFIPLIITTVVLMTTIVEPAHKITISSPIITPPAEYTDTPKKGVRFNVDSQGRARQPVRFNDATLTTTHTYDPTKQVLSKKEAKEAKKQRKYWSSIENNRLEERKRKLTDRFKYAFKMAGVVVRPIKRLTTAINKGLAKASSVEKRLHNFLAETFFNGPYRLIGTKLTKIHFKVCTALEPILGKTLIRVSNKIIGGIIVIGERVGKFLIDNLGTIIGMGIGILVGLAIAAGLDYAAMNPVVGGAIGGAVSAIVSTFTGAFFTCILKGNLIPTSIEDAAFRTVTLGAEMTLAGAIGGAAGAATGGISMFADPGITVAARVGVGAASMVAYRGMYKVEDKVIKARNEKKEIKKWEKYGIHSEAEKKLRKDVKKLQVSNSASGLWDTSLDTSSSMDTSIDSHAPIASTYKSKILGRPFLAVA